MKILLTGGTGFLGTSFIRYITENQSINDLDITVLSSGRTKSTITLPDVVKFRRIDLTQPVSVEQMQEFAFDAVLHFATTSTLGPKHSEYQRFHEINLIDNVTLNIVKAVKAKRLIWASSGAVYGPIKSSEETLETNQLVISDLFNSNAYRIGKIQSEFHAAKFAENNNIKLDILRLFAFSGVDLPLNAHFAVGNFVHDVIYGNCINILGTGLARRSYLDQNDLAMIINWFLQNPPKDFRLINVGSDKGFSLRDVAQLMQEISRDVLEKKCQIRTHNKIKDYDNYYVPDISLLKNTVPNLHFKDLRTTLTEMILHAAQ